MMKVLLLSALCFTAFSANLRSAQSSMMSVDLLQPVELFIQLFGQTFDTTTQALETQFLTMLYPDTFTDVQGQLDTCEANFWASQVTDLQAINADMWGLVTACTAEDPAAPINQLIQDTLTLMATFSANCEGLSVDLPGDINNLVAASIVQGFQYVQPWTGPLAQWSAAAVAPLEPSASYVQPVTQLTDSVALMAGVTADTVTQTDTDVTASINSWNQVLNNLAANGSLSQDDIVAALGSELALLNDGGASFGQVIQSSAQYLVQAVQATCSFAGPLLSLVSPAPAASS